MMTELESFLLGVLKIKSSKCSVPSPSLSRCKIRPGSRSNNSSFQLRAPARCQARAQRRPGRTTVRTELLNWPEPPTLGLIGWLYDGDLVTDYNIGFLRPFAICITSIILYVISILKDTFQFIPKGNRWLISYIKTIFFEDKVLACFHHFDCGMKPFVMSLLVGAALVPCSSSAVCIGPVLCIRDVLLGCEVWCR